MASTAEIPHELIRTIADGQCVLFVGSGLSRHTYGLATWGEFIQNVRETLAADHGTTDDTDEANVASYPLEYLEYAKLNFNSQYIAAVKSELSVGGTVQAQQAHRVIASLPWSAIVTTNLDTLLEDSLEHPVVVSSEKDLPQIGLASGPLLIKMHGSATTREGHVLTRFEYLEFLESRRAMQAIVLTLFSQFPVLVVGAGLTDPNFLTIYGMAESALRQWKRPTFYVGDGTPGFVKSIWGQRRM